MKTITTLLLKVFKKEEKFITLFGIITIVLFSATLFSIFKAYTTPHYKVAGYVFGDSNKNGIKEKRELGYKNASLILTGRGIKTPIKIKTDNYGYFNQEVPTSGKYSVAFVTPPGTKLTSPGSPALVILDTKTKTQTLTFGTVASDSRSQLSRSLNRTLPLTQTITASFCKGQDYGFKTPDGRSTFNRSIAEVSCEGLNTVALGDGKGRRNVLRCQSQGDRCLKQNSCVYCANDESSTAPTRPQRCPAGTRWNAGAEECVNVSNSNNTTGSQSIPPATCPANCDPNTCNGKCTETEYNDGFCGNTICVPNSNSSGRGGVTDKTCAQQYGSGFTEAINNSQQCCPISAPYSKDGNCYASLNNLNNSASPTYTCDQGFVMSNGACCPAAAPYNVNGECYATPPGNSTTTSPEITGPDLSKVTFTITNSTSVPLNGRIESRDNARNDKIHAQICVDEYELGCMPFAIIPTSENETISLIEETQTDGGTKICAQSGDFKQCFAKNLGEKCNGTYCGQGLCFKQDPNNQPFCVANDQADGVMCSSDVMCANKNCSRSTASTPGMCCPSGKLFLSGDIFGVGGCFDCGAENGFACEPKNQQPACQSGLNALPADGAFVCCASGKEWSKSSKTCIDPTISTTLKCGDNICGQNEICYDLNPAGPFCYPMLENDMYACSNDNQCKSGACTPIEGTNTSICTEKTLTSKRPDTILGSTYYQAKGIPITPESTPTQQEITSTLKAGNTPLINRESNPYMTQSYCGDFICSEDEAYNNTCPTDCGNSELIVNPY